MKEYQTGQIRNVALVSHNGAGKTTMVERLLFDTGAITRLGKVQDGTATTDFEEEEVARNSSTSTAIAPIEYAGLKVNLLDTPGYVDFVGEMNAALSVADGALILVESVAGVEVGTEIAWQATLERDLPRIIVINKMNRDNARAARAMASIRENLDSRFISLQLPIGEGPEFKGIIDLISMEARLGDNDARGPIPAELVDDAEAAREEMIEAAAEGDDALMEKFFAEEPFTEEDVIRGLKGAIAQRLCTPVMYAAPEAGIAVKPLLGAVTKLMPAPDEDLATPGEKKQFVAKDKDGNEATYDIADDSPLAAFIFKTRDDQYGKMSYIRVYGGTLESDSRVWDSTLDSEVRVGPLQVIRGSHQTAVGKLHAGDIGVVVKLGEAGTNDTLCQRNEQLFLPEIEQPEPIVSVSITAETQADVAKMSQALNRLAAEDKTLRWHNEPATRETILSGMGNTHLDMAIKKAKSKFGVTLNTHTPRIPYREAITSTASAEHTHKKQSGGAGQYARVMLRVESLDDDEEFTFDSEIFGGSISAPFVAAVEKGCRQSLEGGVLAGYPVTGVKAVVFDGKEHPVDSKEIAFQTAGREVFKKAVMAAKPVLLEPIYEAEVTVLSENMGDVMSDFNSRRARVLGMEQVGNKTIVRAEVPLAEMQTYQQDLRSMTGGRGVYAMKFLHYGRVPSHLAERIVAENKREETEE